MHSRQTIYRHIKATITSISAIMLLATFIVACEKLEVPDEIENPTNTIAEPEFYVRGMLGETEINLTAGVNSIFLYSSKDNLDDTLVNYLSKFDLANCPDCKGQFLISFKTNKELTSITQAKLIKAPVVIDEYQIAFQSSVFHNFSSSPSLLWTLSDGQTSNEPNPMFNISNNVTARLTTTLSGNTAFIENPVYTDTNCTLHFSAKQTLVPQQFKFEAITSNDLNSVNWIGAFGIKNSTVFTHQYGSSIIDLVTCTANFSDGCERVYRQNVVIDSAAPLVLAPNFTYSIAEFPGTKYPNQNGRLEMSFHNEQGVKFTAFDEINPNSNITLGEFESFTNEAGEAMLKASFSFDQLKFASEQDTLEAKAFSGKIAFLL